MRHPALVRRPSLSLSIAALGAGALVAALAACAASPVDDDPGGVVAETNGTEGEGKSTVLPPSNPPASSDDAGSATPPKDAGSTPPKKDSGTSTPPADAGSTGTGGSCDPNDPLMLVKALAEVGSSSPRTCGIMGGSCQASECCFDVYGVCVDP